MNFKVVYTCNCIDKKMRKELLDSVISIRQYIPKEDVIVIFHPPLDNLEEIKKMFDKYVDLRIVDDTITTPFAIHPSRGKETERWYGEKLRIKDLPYENIAFFDCDTVFLRHPKYLFDGEFDFAGVPMDTLPEHWQTRSNVRIKTKRVFKLPYDRTHCWEGGCLIFKNYTHNKIGNEWLRVLENERHLLDICQSPNRKTYEQSALIPVIARNKDIKIKIIEPFKDMFFRCSYAEVDSINDDIILVHGNDLVDVLGLRDKINDLMEQL